MSHPDSPFSLRRCFHWATIVLAATLVACCPAGGGASELVLQNDSIATPGAGTPLPTFLPNEIVATWHTAPLAGHIVGVQVLWDSALGPNPASQEWAIHVYANGTFPAPGATLATVTAPVLSDGVVNEFRYADPPTDLVPLHVPVSAGQTFVVGLEFLNQSSGNPLASSVEIDSDGIQANKNSVYVNPPNGAWYSAGPQGVNGDFGIRAILQSVPEPASATLLVLGLLMCNRRSNNASNRATGRGQAAVRAS